MNIFEIFFLKLGFGWTVSKLLIYIFILIISFGLAIYQRRWKTSIKWFYWFRVISISIIPVVIYFFFFPIYTGDIKDYSKKVESNFQFSKGKALNIIVLRNCPYCKNTIEYTDMLIARNENIQITYYVLGNKNGDKGFLKEINEKCKIKFVRNVKKIHALTNGSYPAFILSENKKAKLKWSNDQFGFKSLDVIESFLLE